MTRPRPFCILLLASVFLSISLGGASLYAGPPVVGPPVMGPPVVGPPAVPRPVVPEPVVLDSGEGAPVAVALDLVQRTLLRRSSKRYLVCGHRGAYFHKPHNSPRSTEQAIRSGADLIELDIETTADLKPILAHDPWPRKKTLAQWRAARKGITPLGAALQLIGHRAVVVLDLKTPHVAPVVNAVRAVGAQGRVVFFPGTGAAYHALRKIAPKAYVMARARNESDVNAFLASGDKSIVIIHGDYEWMHGNIVARIRKSGRRAFVNSYKLKTMEERFGAMDTVTRVFRRGICIAQTNHVRTAVAARRRMARRQMVRGR